MKTKEQFKQCVTDKGDDYKRIHFFLDVGFDKLLTRRTALSVFDDEVSACVEGGCLLQELDYCLVGGNTSRLKLSVEATVPDQWWTTVGGEISKDYLRQIRNKLDNSVEFYIRVKENDMLSNNNGIEFFNDQVSDQVEDGHKITDLSYELKNKVDDSTWLIGVTAIADEYYFSDA